MTETKFTQGPWKIGAYESGQMAVDGANGEEVTGYIDPEDAHLIAAAPDMYAELEAAMKVFRFYQGHHAAKGHSEKEQTNKQYADKIAKVLEKARGEA